MDIQIEQIPKKEREEIIKYGIKRCKVIFISNLITIMLGWFLGVIWQSIIFWLCLSILRKYVGGYHADTEKRCYVISFIVVVTSLLFIKAINNVREFGLIVQTLNLFIILLLAPVENKNHILDADEKRRYGIQGKITAILFYIICIFLFFINEHYCMVAIATANLTGAILLIFGFFKTQKRFSSITK